MNTKTEFNLAEAFVKLLQQADEKDIHGATATCAAIGMGFTLFATECRCIGAHTRAAIFEEAAKRLERVGLVDLHTRKPPNDSPQATPTDSNPVRRG